MRYLHVPLWKAADAGQAAVSEPIRVETLERVHCIVHGLKNVRGELRIEASHDGEHWTPVEKRAFNGDDVGTINVLSVSCARFVRFAYDGTAGDPIPAVPPTNEVQVWAGAAGVTGGTFTIGDGTTTSAPISIDGFTVEKLQAACDDVWGAGNVAVSIVDGPPTFEFTGALSEQPMPLVIIDATQLIGTPPQNAQWVLEVADAEGGTFAISRNGAKAESLAYDATAQAIEDACNIHLGYGDVFSASGGPLNTEPVTIELVGALAGAAGNVAELLLTDIALVGESANVHLTRQQEGADAIVPTGEVVRLQEGHPGSPEQPADPGELNGDFFGQGWS